MTNEETAVEDQEQAPEEPIEVKQYENMSDGLDMEYGLGDLAPKNNSNGFDMGLNLGIDF